MVEFTRDDRIRLTCSQRYSGCCDVDQDCEFAGDSFYVGQLLRGQLGYLKDAVWLNETVAHSARSVRRHRSREIVVTVENVRRWFSF